MELHDRKKSLGKRIRTIREKQGISQRRFALMIGLGQTYLSDVENGQRNIGFENLCKIADGLGVSIGTLADQDREEQSDLPIQKRTKKIDTKKIVTNQSKTS